MASRRTELRRRLWCTREKQDSTESPPTTLTSLEKSRNPRPSSIFHCLEKPGALRVLEHTHRQRLRGGGASHTLRGSPLTLGSDPGGKVRTDRPSNPPPRKFLPCRWGVHGSLPPHAAPTRTVVLLLPTTTTDNNNCNCYSVRTGRCSKYSAARAPLHHAELQAPRTTESMPCSDLLASLAS